MNATRWLALVLVVALSLSGPAARLAWGQEAQQPQYWSPAPVEESGGPAYTIAAGMATAINIPGRIATCALGHAAGFALLAITLGSGYKAFMSSIEEGCRGPWILTGQDMRSRSPLDYTR
jgi:hypothetical protein